MSTQWNLDEWSEVFSNTQICIPARPSNTKHDLVPEICVHNHLADTCKECKKGEPCPQR